jgi:hypothetical protein
MKKTFKELIEVDKMIGDMYASNPELPSTKFGYAYKRYSEKTYWPMVKDRQEAINEARIDNALTDKVTGAIIYDNKNKRGYAFSPAGLKEVIKAEKRIAEDWNEREMDIKEHFCAKTNIPKELTPELKKALKGLVIE